MAELATERMVVTATPEQCFAVVSDIERYPEWAADIKQVVVERRDAEGRPGEATFRAGAFGRSTSYTLAYDYSQAPRDPGLEADRGRPHLQARRELPLRRRRGRLDRGHLHPGGRAARPAAGLHQAPGAEPHHAHRPRGAQGTGRVLAHDVSGARPRPPPTGTGGRRGEAGDDRDRHGGHQGARRGRRRRGRGAGGGARRRARAAPPRRCRARAPPSSGADDADVVIEVLASVAEQLRDGIDGRGGVGGRGRARAWSTTPGCCASPPTCRGGTGSTSPAAWPARLGGMRTVVDNDATCATVAEWAFGAAAGATDAVMVTLGTGIGGRGHRRGPRGAGGLGVRRRDRPHGGRPDGAAVPVRQAGLLGALRLGQRPRAPGPRGGPCRAARPGGGPGRWGCRVGAGRARARGGQGRRRRRPGRAGRARLVAGARPLQPGPRPRPRRHGATAAGWSRPSPSSSTRCGPPSTSCSRATP